MTMPGFDPLPYSSEDSYGVRLTKRKNALIARGVHPATGFALANNGQGCGSCAHLLGTGRANRYWKCGLVKVTGGPGTDIRKGWPACVKWEAR